MRLDFILSKIKKIRDKYEKFVTKKAISGSETAVIRVFRLSCGRGAEKSGSREKGRRAWQREKNGSEKGGKKAENRPAGDGRGARDSIFPDTPAEKSGLKKSFKAASRNSRYHQ